MPHSDHNNEYFHLPHDKKYCHYMKKFFQCNQNCMPVCMHSDNFPLHGIPHLLQHLICKNNYNTSYCLNQNHPRYNLQHTSYYPASLRSIHDMDWLHRLQICLLHCITGKRAVHNLRILSFPSVLLFRCSAALMLFLIAGIIIIYDVRTYNIMCFFNFKVI